MRAIIVIERVYDGVMDFIHDLGGHDIRRIVVPDKNNLAITPVENFVSTIRDFTITENCKIIDEIDIPEELIEQVITLDENQKELHSQLLALI